MIRCTACCGDFFHRVTRHRPRSWGSRCDVCPPELRRLWCGRMPLQKIPDSWQHDLLWPRHRDTCQDDDRCNRDLSGGKLRHPVSGRTRGEIWILTNSASAALFICQSAFPEPVLPSETATQSKVTAKQRSAPWKSAQQWRSGRLYWKMHRPLCCFL